MAKRKNIIIFIVIGIVSVLVYVFFIKASPKTETLISSVPISASSNTILGEGSSVAKDFLNLLLSVKNIKLDDAVLSDNAFISLHDSSILLIPDGTEGRPNPFAPLGVDNVALPISAISIPAISEGVTATPVTSTPPITPSITTNPPIGSTPTVKKP